MKSLVAALYFLLVVSSVAFNLFLPETDQEAMVTILAFYNLTTAIYFVFQSYFGKSKLLFNPKHYCLFPISYWEFFKYKLLNDLIRKMMIIPLLLSPIAVIFSPLETSVSILLCIVEYLVIFTTLFVFLFLYQQILSRRLKQNLLPYLLFLPLFFYIVCLRLESGVPMLFNITGGYWNIVLLNLQNEIDIAQNAFVGVGLSVALFFVIKRLSKLWPGF